MKSIFKRFFCAAMVAVSCVFVGQVVNAKPCERKLVVHDVCPFGPSPTCFLTQGKNIFISGQDGLRYSVRILSVKVDKEQCWTLTVWYDDAIVKLNEDDTLTIYSNLVTPEGCTGNFLNSDTEETDGVVVGRPDPFQDIAKRYRRLMKKRGQIRLSYRTRGGIPEVTFQNDQFHQIARRYKRLMKK